MQNLVLDNVMSTLCGKNLHVVMQSVPYKKLQSFVAQELGLK